MSAVAPLLKPLGLRAPDRTIAKPATKSRPRLVLISAPRRSAGRVPFAILIGALLVTGLVTLLMLHTIAAQDGFKANTLQDRQKTLNDQLQSMEQVVQADSSPGMLRQRAAALGMVPSVVDSYHRLKDGRARGLEIPVIPAPPVLATTTTKTATTTNGAAGKAASTGKAGSTTTTGTATGTAAATGTTATGTTATTGTTGTGKHHHGQGTTTSPTATTSTTTSTTPQTTTKHPGHPHQ